MQLVLAVKDEKANSFMKPVFDVTKGSAARSFGDAVLDEKLPFGTHPEDYALYLIGQYDESTGVIKGLEKPELVCKALDYKSKK